MSIWTKVILVLSGAFILSAVMASCSSGPTTVEIVKTTRAQNKIDNLAATREVALAAGENPDDVQVKIAKGSQADKVIEERNATATALAEEGIVSVGSGSDIVKEVTRDVEMPDGPAETGLIEIPIILKGAEGVRFDPEIVKITVGSTVKWINPRKMASTSTADEEQADYWDSGVLSKPTFPKKNDLGTPTGEGYMFEHTFNIPGCFAYSSQQSGDTGLPGAGLGAVCVVEE